jgi:hypothetical protein
MGNHLSGKVSFFGGSKADKVYIRPCRFGASTVPSRSLPRALAALPEMLRWLLSS